MAVKLRLQRKGRTKAPFYHIVVADARSPRDGRFIEKLGTYNPLTVPATIELDRQRAYDWLLKGAQPTDTVRAILRFKGVLYQKHLAVGVQKGAMTPEQAEAKLNAWLEEKESRIAQRREATAEKRRQFIASVDGTPKAKAAKPIAEAPAPAEAPEVTEAAAPVAEMTEAAVVETTAEEAAPVVEAVEETAPAIEAAEEATPAIEAAEEAAPAVETAEEATPAAETAEEEAPAAEEKTEE